MSTFDAELVSPRIVKDVAVDGVRHVEAHFSNERQIQEWLAEQRAAGSKIEIRRGRKSDGVFSPPLHRAA
jgi:hypothetical protein